MRRAATLAAALAAVLTVGAASLLLRAHPGQAASLAGPQTTTTPQTCQVKLTNTPTSGEVAPPASAAGDFEIGALDTGTVTWPAATTSTTFRTCPPSRVMLIGDSIAFTIGLPYLADEQNYGIALSDSAILGCAFHVSGELDVNGTWEEPPAGCPDELNTWARRAGAFGANEVIFELGYRDEFNWRSGGQISHLGEPAFDNDVENRIKTFIKVLGDNGRRKLLFLSIPLVAPKQLPGGATAPQTYTVRNTEINHLIAEAAKTDGADAEVLDIDKVLAPGGKYTADIHGKDCRADGIHVTFYCAGLLESDIFSAARDLLAR